MLTRLWERVLPTVTDRPPLNLAIFNDTGATRHYGCELVMSTLTGGLTAHGMTSAWSHRVGVDWRTFRHEIPRFPAIAGIVVNGEGSIHHSASRPRARYLSQLGNFAHDDLGVPAFLLNATISDIEDDVADELRAFDRIWVRESGSLAELEARAITSKVVPDLTLSTPLKSAWRRSGICGTDSVLGEVSQAIATLCDRRGLRQVAVLARIGRDRQIPRRHDVRRDQDAICRGRVQLAEDLVPCPGRVRRHQARARSRCDQAVEPRQLRHLVARGDPGVEGVYASRAAQDIPYVC